MKNVLIINQSAELYGADKVLLELLESYPKGFNPIVVLHEDGPLKDRLENMDIQVIRSSVIKVKRGILKPGFFLRLPFEIIFSIFRIKKELKGKKIAFVHSNATSVFIGVFYAFFMRKKHLWHVHEIIENPKTVAWLYPKIVYLFSNKIIFNSKGTEAHFLKYHPKISKRSKVIYNGIKRINSKTNESQIKHIKEQEFNAKPNEVILTLIGRISQIKGQKLLVTSFKEVLKKFPNTRLVFIGSYVKGKKEYFDELSILINSLDLNNHISFVGFQENIWPYYDASDILIMPSTEPESFGLVAAEALLSTKPVIASNIGALPEIILNQNTGLLFEANNSADLTSKICLLLKNKVLGKKLAINGFHHVKTNFSNNQMSESFTEVYSEML
jgi:glycosyltransferase involved in cell wall biosynthesis